ncbi:MAG: 3-dehydroquinate synthase, partial [Pseudomonadota bacterium]
MSGAAARIVPVALGARSYEITVGSGVLAGAGAWLGPHLRRPRVAVLTDETVAAAHGAALSRALEAEGIAEARLALPPGEATKGWAGLERAVEWLIAERVERDDMIVAFGGGVIGDLA